MMPLEINVEKVWNFTNSKNKFDNSYINIDLGNQSYVVENRPDYIEEIYSEKENLPEGVVIAVYMHDPDQEMSDSVLFFDKNDVYIFNTETGELSKYDASHDLKENSFMKAALISFINAFQERKKEKMELFLKNTNNFLNNN